MKNDFPQNTCRVCLTRSKKLRSIYKPIDEGEEAPHHMLEKITGICLEAIDEMSYLPKNICKNCELALNMAFEFRMKALKSHRFLEHHTRNKNQKSRKSIEVNEVGDKHEIKEDMDDSLIEIQHFDVDMLEENFEDCSLHIIDSDTNHMITVGENQKYILKHEDSVDNENNEAIVKDSLKDNEELYSEEASCNIKDEEIMVEEHLEVDKTTQLNENKDSSNSLCNENEPVRNVKHSRKSSRKGIKAVKTNKEKVKRGQKPSTTESQVGFICDICGNVYAKRGRMMEHRQRHDKELRYACELCDKKFHMRELLRKHMFSHSGGKPLKCDYCSRTFYYESVRKAHEAVHKGLRPYVCDICNKSFSYAHALKKHQLIHAQIKLYRCSYCDKDFRLQHHMKQHLITKLHQNAVRSAMENQSLTNESMESGDEFVISTPHGFGAM